MPESDGVTLDHAFAPYRAGIDITTAYSADSYLSAGGVQDPWYRECLMTLIDVVINHGEVYYPLPTVRAVHNADLLEDLPRILSVFRQIGIIAPTRHQVAASLQPTQEALQTEFSNFSKWASDQSNWQKLRQWIALQTSGVVGPGTISRLGPIGVQEFTVEFWQQNAVQTERLAQALRVKSEHLRLAFDVMFRGLQYYALLSAEDIPYFSHPVRHALLATQQARHYEYSGAWSWGRLLLNLLENKRIGRDPEQLVELVAKIKGKVGLLGATSYSLAGVPEQDRIEIITTVAAECGVPSRMKDSVIRRIQAALGLASAASSFVSFPAVMIILGIGTVGLSYWTGEIPGAVGQEVKFVRGLLEWPGLFPPR